MLRLLGPKVHLYARGKFDQGGTNSNGNPNLLFIELKTVESCPHSKLKGIEVRIGGVQRSGFRNPAPNYHPYTQSNCESGSINGYSKDDKDVGVGASFYLVLAIHIFIPRLMYPLEILFRQVFTTLVM